MRLDHLLSREHLWCDRRRAPPVLECRPGLGEPPRTPDRAYGAELRGARMLSSFERPAPAGAHGFGISWVRRARRRRRLSADLENCTVEPMNGYHRVSLIGWGDHRQDSKGRWWMPWHQESMKGVNGCDKPRLGAE